MHTRSIYISFHVILRKVVTIYSLCALIVLHFSSNRFESTYFFNHTSYVKNNIVIIKSPGVKTQFSKKYLQHISITAFYVDGSTNVNKIKFQQKNKRRDDQKKIVTNKKKYKMTDN